jgi:phosphatidylglycerophosphate synthase
MDERLTVPNVLTASRMAMAVVAAGLAARADEVALALCVGAVLLDAFDGWYARAFSQCSRLGKHLDPFADKVLMGVVYGWVGVDAGSRVVWGLLALVGVREVAMTVLRAYSVRRYATFIPASGLGRAKMAAQSVVGLGILGYAHVLDRVVPIHVVIVGLLAIVAITYASALDYARGWKPTTPLRDEPALRDREQAAVRVATGR